MINLENDRFQWRRRLRRSKHVTALIRALRDATLAYMDREPRCNSEHVITALRKLADGIDEIRLTDGDN